MSVFDQIYDRDHVRNIQRALNEYCYMLEDFVSLQADGVFGPKSVAMLQAAQRKAGVIVSGRYDGPIREQLEALIEQRFISASQLRELATQYGYSYAEVAAVVDVESRGDGFLTNTRATILFERHKFYQAIKALKGAAVANQLMAKYPDIVNSSSGGYLGGGREWERLERAMNLSTNGDLTEAAIESASWGLGQIMGFHWRKLGYAGAIYMFAAAMRSEAEQIDMMLRFIKSEPGLDRALRAHDWADFARRYNGPAYKKNNYDVRLADAYRKFA